jgi:GTP-binding protein Era
VRSGFVAVAGRPNVGKSTLVNALCGGKIAIVSDKPQTTRRRISGVANGPGFQLVLVDLPGFQRPLDPMTERMQRTVDASLEGVDAVLLVIAANEPIGAGDRFVAARAFGGDAPVVIALNKIDRVAEGLRETLAALLPEGPEYFPRGEITDMTLEHRIAELVREQALARTREEVPHAISVQVTELEPARVRAELIVETESQKAIVVGKGGSMIKAIGSGARPEIESLLGRRVFLELQVRVRPKWRQDEGLLERLGI